MLPDNYPFVQDEETTLDYVLRGGSIIRLGDGDFRIIRGQGDVFQKWTPNLARRLAEMLTQERPDGLLVCLPRIVDLPLRTPVLRHWMTWLESDAGVIALIPPGRVWGSSNLFRGDSAPWIHNAAYWAKVQRLWADKRVALVGSGNRSMTREGLEKSLRPPKGIVNFEVSARHCYYEMPVIRDKVLQNRTRFETVLIAAGQGGRTLAWDLAKEGLHVVDIGHLGLFFGPDAHQFAPGHYPWDPSWPVKQVHDAWQETIEER